MNLIIWHSKADTHKSKFTLIIKTATGVATPLHRVEGSDNSPIPQFVLGRKHSANHSLRALITTLVNPIPQQQCRGVQSMLMSFVCSVHTQATTANVATSNHRRDIADRSTYSDQQNLFIQCHCCHTCCGKLIAFLQNKLGYWSVIRPFLSMRRGGNARLLLCMGKLSLHLQTCFHGQSLYLHLQTHYSWSNSTFEFLY